MAFVAVILLLLAPYLVHLSREQIKTFAAVTEYLSHQGLRQLPGQRESSLIRRGDSYYWSGIVWKKTDNTWAPYEFIVGINAANNDSIIRANLTPCDSAPDSGLQIYDEVTTNH